MSKKQSPVILLAGDIRSGDLRITIKGEPSELAFLIGLGIKSNPHFLKVVEAAVSSVVDVDCSDAYDAIVNAMQEAE